MSEQEEALSLAKWMHEHYELLAAEEGWKTQEISHVEFDKLPEENRRVMERMAAAITRKFKTPRKYLGDAALQDANNLSYDLAMFAGDTCGEVVELRAALTTANSRIEQLGKALRPMAERGYFSAELSGMSAARFVQELDKDTDAARAALANNKDEQG